LKALPRGGTTLVIYMPGSNYERLARALREAGFSAETPCLIVSQATTPQEAIYRTNISSLAGVPAPPAPALLVVGEVTATAKSESAGALAGHTSETRHP
jgi:siroheme synthase